jgi:hypothetical protein
VGGHVVEDGGCGHIDDVGLAERGGNGELVSLFKELVVLCCVILFFYILHKSHLSEKATFRQCNFPQCNFPKCNFPRCN